MELDLDTFLTIVYCTIDELYQTHSAPRKPVRPGPAPELHDSEVLTLMLYQLRIEAPSFIIHADILSEVGDAWT